jgi:hypothetical protein
LSCRKAKILSAGDYQYQRMVRGGAAPEEIAVALGLHPEIHSPAKVRAKVPDELIEEDVPEAVEDQDAPEPEPKPERALEVFPKRNGPTGPQLPEGVTRADVRAWARANNIKVNDRGNIARAVMDAYLAAMEPSAPAGRDESPAPSADPSDVGEAASASRAADGTASQPKEDETKTASSEVPDLSLDGATQRPDPNVQVANAGEFAAIWNGMTPNERDDWTAAIVRSAAESTRCFIQAHDDRIAQTDMLVRGLRDLTTERDEVLGSLEFVLRKWAELHVIVSNLTAITDEQEAEISRLRIERDLAVLGEDYWAAAFRAEARTVAELRAAEHVPFWRRRAS